MKNKSLYADLSLLIVAIVWGTGFIASKEALNHFSPYWIMAIRFSIASIVLGVVFFKKISKIKLKDFKAGAIVGFFLFTAFAAQTIGLQYTTPGKQAFLTGTNVVIVPFLYWIINKKSPDKFEFSATFICLIGISLLTLNEGLYINLGDGLTLLCALLFACHIVSTGFFASKHDPILIAFTQIFVAAIFSIFCALVFDGMPSSSSNVGLFSVIYLGIFSTCMAFFIQTVAQKHTSSTHAAIILSLESVFGSVFSAIILSEVFTSKMLIGCVLMFIAIITAETKLNFLFKNSTLNLNKN